MTLSEELRARGFIHQCSSESLELVLDNETRTVYHGIDPTADSAHAGNFVNWVLLRHLVNHGHKVIFLVGGGTGRIGDPKPDAERELVSTEVIDERVTKLKAQAKHLLGTTEVVFVNNQDWLGSLNLIDFLRDIGKHFTVNELIKKDAIANRLSSEVGLSYTEFAYPLLQAFDYLQLYRQHNCTLQVGGSDQWGNIVAGVDLVRRLEQTEVFALTQPLVTDKATGKKFGKSEGNAVWLDAEKTSPYTFYQFWLNTSDDSVIEYLKRFTFISLAEIAEIEKAFLENPGSRSAQKHLAEAVTTFVHGETVAKSVIAASEILFGERNITELSADSVTVLLENAPTHDIAGGESIIDVLVASGLATSKREARTFIESGAVTLDDKKITDTEAALTSDVLANPHTLLRRGKKQYVILVQK
ncbi:MAG: tyrosine--tRNA ligase [Candidatus Paceibacterota bacterium]